MELTIEKYGSIGVGHYPDFLQFPETEGQQFYIKNDRLFALPSTKIDNGEFESAVWLDELDVSVDEVLSFLEIKSLAGFGAVGSYLESGVGNDEFGNPNPDRQVMIIYEFEFDMSEYLNSGSIKFSSDTPISSFTLTLENPIDTRTEIEGAIAINEETSLLSPGARVSFRFKAGDDLEEVELGSFYIDRSDYSVLSDKASVNGRNLIGKALKDQTMNENCVISFQDITTSLSEILENANLNEDQYLIEDELAERSFEFTPSKEVFSAIKEIMQSMIDWKMEEIVGGEIVIGSPTYGHFPTRSTYTFNRNKDIFSRQITKDDQSAYRRVCVHTPDFSLAAYDDVVSYTGWNLQSNKTIFISVPDGTSQADAESIAEEIANRLENVGKIETFSGPFRPQLLVGDGATIVNDDGGVELGLITEVTHNFGKSGFTTSFTVDSGGKLGKGRLSDFINLIATTGAVGSIAYADV